MEKHLYILLFVWIRSTVRTWLVISSLIMLISPKAIIMVSDLVERALLTQAFFFRSHGTPSCSDEKSFRSCSTIAWTRCTDRCKCCSSSSRFVDVDCRFWIGKVPVHFIMLHDSMPSNVFVCSLNIGHRSIDKMLMATHLYIAWLDRDLRIRGQLIFSCIRLDPRLSISRMKITKVCWVSPVNMVRHV